MSWRDEAACRGQDPAIFFPERGGDVTMAVSFCERCPVRESCLAEAMQNREEFGVWGGVSGRARRTLRGRGGYQIKRRCFFCSATFFQPTGENARKYCTDECAATARSEQKLAHSRRSRPDPYAVLSGP